ncbi:HAD family hydrolase [Larkinella terrae]|uniref:HAD-IA family hydrolase n=1 Tax=Larkinella terrae TaxID=2025311 RepID=A0A7K0ETX9_9BACT|nr:HAD family phosphatase [Larkinella terrae]MRS65265.1 HAD-IA family hydrolase [Larkinella terrae]
MKAVLFDMDGVIVDTNPHHRLAWRSYFERYGKPLTDADFVQYVSGKHNNDILSHLFPDRSLSLTEARQLAAEKEALFRELYLPDIQPVAGLAGFLQLLRNSGIRTAVATSAPVENLDFVMDTLNLRAYFDVLLDESKVSHPKPNPEIYQKGMQLLSVEPNESVIFEDSTTGIRAAKAAGAYVIGLTTTDSAKELISAGADEVIGDFTELSPDRFQELANRSVSV